MISNHKTEQKTDNKGTEENRNLQSVHGNQLNPKLAEQYQNLDIVYALRCTCSITLAEKSKLSEIKSTMSLRDKSA